jgi:hypothetical protein
MSEIAEAISGHPRYPIAEMYRRWALDELVELAHAISFDFFNRPSQYRYVPEDVGDILANFQSCTGFQPDWPSTLQQLRIYLPLLGGAFCSAGSVLREAAIAFLKQASSENQEVLRQFGRDKAVLLRSHLNTLEGRALSVADKQTGAIFGKVVDVLRCQEVCSIFGLPSPPGADWPFLEPSSEDSHICVRKSAER